MNNIYITAGFKRLSFSFLIFVNLKSQLVIKINTIYIFYYVPNNVSVLSKLLPGNILLVFDLFYNIILKKNSIQIFPLKIIRTLKCNKNLK